MDASNLTSDERICSVGLIQSYVQDHYFVSTAYRRSSAMLNPQGWYYETIVWNWNPETKERGEIVDSRDCGVNRLTALACHAAICASLASDLIAPESRR